MTIAVLRNDGASVFTMHCLESANFTSFGYFYGHHILALAAKSVARPLSSFSMCVFVPFFGKNLHFQDKQLCVSSIRVRFIEFETAQNYFDAQVLIFQRNKK